VGASVVRLPCDPAGVRTAAGDRVELTIRTIEPEETGAFAHAFHRVFAGAPSDHGLARLRRRLEPERTIVGIAPDGDVVATAGAYSFDLALPGAAAAGCAGITMVSVRPDHRRRGVLTRLLGWLHEQARSRGEPFAALWASESPIYGRFGYGPAIPHVAVTAERAHVRFTVPADVGAVALVDRERALAELPPIREAVRRERPGMLSRSAAWWEQLLDEDPVSERDGHGPRGVALVPGRGYAIHRVRGHWTDGAPAGTVRVDELHATDPEAAAALWAFVTDLDLTSRIVAETRPVDDPVLAMIEDTGRLQVAAGWPLYLRILDLPAAMTARRYASDGELVLQVSDGGVPPNAGRWILRVRDGVARCEPSGRPADLELDVRELATVVLGGVRVGQLAAAGRVRVIDPTAPDRLDAMLRTPLAPWHEGMF
jgi:predicted acetyltransferase